MSDSGFLNDSSSADPGATPNPPPTPPQGQPADDSGWLTSLPEEMRGLAEHKGWKEPADALKSYQHLEQVFGADKAGRALLMPKDAEDKEGYDQVYKALGRPDDVDGYELKSVFGDDEVDETLLGTMAKTMHEAGLSKAQAQKMSAAYQEMYKAGLAEAEARLMTEIKDLETALPAETQEMARRGFRLFGLPKAEGDAVSDALVRALGPRQAVELFARLGQAAGEDRAPGGATSAGGGAKARIDRLLADPAFLARYRTGDQDAISQISELSRLAMLE